MSQFSASLSTVPISFFDTSGSLVYIPAGTSESLFNLINNDLQAFVDASSSMKVESINEDLEFKDPRNSTTFLYLSSSGNHSRVGIGTTDPQSTIDFRDAEDSTTGTEIVLRTSRLTKGAEIGDEGGSINFTIDSGSFANLKTSGSLAKIKTLVDQVGIGGVQGKLVFELSKGAGPEGNDVFSYGFNQISGFNLYSQIQSASLLIKDFSPTGYSKFEMRDNSDNTKLSILRGNITASGDISCSGDLIGNINGGTF